MTDLFASWMIGGSRLDIPEPRQLAHLVALREAKRLDSRTSPFARLAERVRFAQQARPATDAMTICCTA